MAAGEPVLSVKERLKLFEQRGQAVKSPAISTSKPLKLIKTSNASIQTTEDLMQDSPTSLSGLSSDLISLASPDSTSLKVDLTPASPAPKSDPPKLPARKASTSSLKTSPVEGTARAPSPKLPPRKTNSLSVSSSTSSLPGLPRRDSPSESPQLPPRPSISNATVDSSKPRPPPSSTRPPGRTRSSVSSVNTENDDILVQLGIAPLSLNNTSLGLSRVDSNVSTTSSTRRKIRPVDPKAKRRYEEFYAELMASRPATNLPSREDGLPGVVVCRVWQRSNLSAHRLRDIWIRVDPSRQGYLTQQQFIDGMWAIDEELKAYHHAHRDRPTQKDSL